MTPAASPPAERPDAPAPEQAEPSEAAARPLLRVVRGAPDDAELAAVVAVLVARASAVAPAGPPAPVTRWADPARLLGVAAAPSPDAWRTSTWATR